MPPAVEHLIYTGVVTGGAQHPSSTGHVQFRPAAGALSRWGWRHAPLGGGGGGPGIEAPGQPLAVLRDLVHWKPPILSKVGSNLETSNYYDLLVPSLPRRTCGGRTCKQWRGETSRTCPSTSVVEITKRSDRITDTSMTLHQHASTRPYLEPLGSHAGGGCSSLPPRPVLTAGRGLLRSAACACGPKSPCACC